MEHARPLGERYWLIEGTGARLIDVPIPDFWKQIMSSDHAEPLVARVAGSDGWLVSTYELASDLEISEMHPVGDELHYLLSGRLRLVLEEEGGERMVELVPGTVAVVPRGVWHRFLVVEPARAIAITCGRGTEHRPVRA